MKSLIYFLKPYSRWILTFWIITISVVSSIPHLPTPKIETGKGVIRLDYLMHFCEYGALIFLSLLSFSGTKLTLSFKRYFLIILSVAVFALADEFHQKLIPGRTSNTRDILSNITGVIAGALICFLLFKKFEKQQNTETT
jgi:VanZ family protein